MTRMVRATACVVILFAVVTAAGATSDGSPGAIRDIRGPIPPSGLPPFTASAALLLLAAAGGAICRLKRSSYVKKAEAVPASGSLLHELQSLRDTYVRGDLPDWLLFDRLSPLIRSLLPTDDHAPLTSRELVAAARGRVPGELLNRAEALLELCDRVRFGGFEPGKSGALRAIDDALEAARNLPEGIR